MIIEKFESRYKYIRASDGYLYGKCARYYHYCNIYGNISFTEQEKKLMSKGTNKHIEKQNELIKQNPSLKAEQEFSSKFLDIRLTCHLDLCNDNIAIEIKPFYSKNAYFQTLIQKLITPYRNFIIYEYINNTTFPIKTNYEMAKVYGLRIYHARNIKPPRKPNVTINSPLCINCLYKGECYKSNSLYENGTKENWQRWTKFINSTKEAKELEI